LAIISTKSAFQCKPRLLSRRARSAMLVDVPATCPSNMFARRCRFRFLRAALLPFLLCALAAGCGQKGDLYLPGGSGSQSFVSGSG
jgi:hypothetical protein